MGIAIRMVKTVSLAAVLLWAAGGREARAETAHLRISKGHGILYLPLMVMEHPDTRFSTTPTGVLRYATFMHQAGTIKVKASSWKELFFPEVHHLPGS